MKEIEAYISPLIKTQFPDFYREEGSRFTDFVTEYYKWLEQQNNATNFSRSLLSKRDIDETSEAFLAYFTNKYLKGIPLTTQANTQFLVKHASEIYRSKGTASGTELLLQGLYNEPATIRFPSKYIFKSSDGTWVKPEYLELSVSKRSKDFVGKEIIGADSGAMAFVESLVKRKINTRFINVAYLSNVRGTFHTGEKITESSNTNLTDAPSITGSLTNLTVVSGGADFRVGNLFDISSSSGKQGVARITEINNETGKVNFIFLDALRSGGWGYSTAHANVIISEKVLTVNNVSNVNTAITGFAVFEGLSQSLANIAYDTANPNNNGFAVGSIVENYYGNGDVSANGVIVATSTTNSTAGYIIVSPNVGNVAQDATFSLKGNTTTATITGYADRTATGTVMGSNTDGYVGVVNIINPFVITPYANIVGAISNTTATVANVSTGTGAAFQIGLLTDTETVFLSPDFLHSNNTGNVVFSTINLNANNSNAAGYGFVKYPGADIDSILLDCLRFDATTIGSIATIVGKNPGSDYNTDPFVLVHDTYVAGYDKHDYVITVTNPSGVFVVGEYIQQTYDKPAVQLTVNNFSGTAANGTSTTTVSVDEFVYQSNATANVAASGFVVEAGIAAGAGTIKLRDVTGQFVVSSTYKIKGLNSGSTANSQAVSNTALAITARGQIKEISNTTVYRIKRINLENTFVLGSSILGKASGVTATLSAFEYEANTPVIGMNANIVANVQTANNVAQKLAVVDSGFGYVDQEVVTLSTANSDYVITAVASLNKQGVGQGFFSSEKGFLDASQRLQDNDYYQNYSYEVVTKIPFQKYMDILKQVSHPVGTKMFGRVDSTSILQSNVVAAATINTTNTA